MNVIELYKVSVELGVEKEDIMEALAFINLHNEGSGRKKALCGYCVNRLNKDCPWPNQCKLTYPACNSFIKKINNK